MTLPNTTMGPITLYGTKGASVTITLVVLAKRHRYEVVGRAPGRHDTYRATIPRCLCERKPCVKERRECSNDHCHRSAFGEQHLEHVEVLAAAVLRTYGKKMPSVNALLKGRQHFGPMAAAQVAEELGITVDEYRAELAKAAS